MLRLSKLSDYAIVIMTDLAGDGHRNLQNAGAIAERTAVAQPTVSKLLKMLAGHGLVKSVQGRHGGYQLGRGPGEITVTQIVEAIDGPLALTECGLDDGVGCDLESVCTVRPHWRHIGGAIRSALDGITLELLIGSPITHLMQWTHDGSKAEPRLTGGQ
jgi:FeS assembly SUF system regulator